MDNVLVVGVDGSDGARRALRWALDEAQRTDAAVRVVAAYQWNSVEAIAPAPGTPAEAREQATQVCATEVANAIAETGDRHVVSCDVVEGRPAEVLTQAARTARLLILGSHGHSRLYHSVLGSVSEECVRQAGCPVVVVPADRAATGADAPEPTGIGTDGS
jgi:nucleotide-binding universal stress UspA family protein